MARDRLYEDILAALRQGGLDDGIFERIAVRIASDLDLNVLPMPGGGDAGYDGAVVEDGLEPGALVVTLSVDGTGNLRRNLTRHTEVHPDASKTAFFVTSRKKSQTQKRNLRDIASGLGYTLVGVADEEAVAEYLYYHPESCEDLLGFRGVPLGLSTFPERRRPYWDIELVGRDEPLERLSTATEDLLLVGVPGTGKTSLLSQLAVSGLGMFARTDDHDRLSEDIRRYRPTVVFVDDADTPLRVVTALLTCREESGIPFRIVVASWAPDEQVIQALNIEDQQIIELEELTLDQLVEVVGRAGLRYPPFLVDDVVRQACGSPGLAVAFAQACLAGGVRSVVTGQRILRHLRATLQRIGVDPAVAESALACFALGGDHGMPTEAVSAFIGMPIFELRALLRKVEVGGVIRPTRTQMVRIQPERLRSALIGATFFSNYPLDIAPMLDAAPNRFEAAMSAVKGSFDTGRTDTLRELVESFNDGHLYEQYAALGAEECAWVLREHPEHIAAVSEPALAYHPERALELLCGAAKGDDRPLNQFPEHPLRIVGGWCSRAELQTAVLRRRLTVEAALRYLEQSGDVDTAVKVAAEALSTAHDSTQSEPGSGLRYTMRWGLLPADSIREIQTLAERVFDSLRGRDGIPVEPLLSAARSALHPRPLRDQEHPAESIEASAQFGEFLIRATAALDPSNQALQIECRSILGELAPEDEMSEQALLFGVRRGGKDWREKEQERHDALDALADDWVDRDPDEVMQHLAEISREAMSVRSFAGVDYRFRVAARLAERVDVLPWLDAAIRHELDAPVVAPLLEAAAQQNVDDWHLRAATLLEDERSAAAAVAVVLGLGEPSELLEQVAPMLSSQRHTVRNVCLRGKVPTRSLRLLLEHEDDRIASTAAVDIFPSMMDDLPEELRPAWEAAIEKTSDGDGWLGDVFAKYPHLASRWLRSRIEAGDWRALTREDMVDDAVTHLTLDERAEMVLTIANPWMHDHLVKRLIGDSTEVFESVTRRTAELQDGVPQELPLLPFTRAIDETWATFVVVATAAGVAPDAVAAASTEIGSYIMANIEELEVRLERASSFTEDARPEVRAVARDLVTRITRRLEESRRDERRRQVYGDRW